MSTDRYDSVHHMHILIKLVVGPLGNIILGVLSYPDSGFQTKYLPNRYSSQKYEK